MKTWVLFNEKDELLIKHENETYRLPTDKDWNPDNSSVNEQGVSPHHVQKDDWVLRVVEADVPSSFVRSSLRQSWNLLSSDEYLRAGKAWELLYWSEETRFCSRCGKPMNWNSDISLVCSNCGREIWPQLNIAIIVLVQKGHEALLVKAKSFRRDFFGLVAGFVETGESLEECVAREVFEETSLRITNIRYFSSQPWPYPLGLMVGFHADYLSGEIAFADGELKEGHFFRADDLPTIPEGLSMARMLIDDWVAKEREEQE